MAENSNLVEFAGSVSAVLPPEMREQLAQELVQVFGPDCNPQRILVSRCFGSYTTNVQDRVVLGVEVRCADNYETHIVKLGSRKEVGPDAAGWAECTQDRQVASRIFSPVRMVAMPAGDRVAVLYRDAYTLFGLNREQSRPEMLETAAEWAVRDDRPDPLSVERAIAQVFTDLGRWFFPGAHSDRDLAAQFYRDRLRCEKDDMILPMWNADSHRRHLRRDAIWLICGRDKPDADPLHDPARYLDPADFVAWMLNPANCQHLPDTLVGRSHGDLHGRNILVGVRRGEVEYPAVFDYGEMGTKNVLAWDFAKLESELKVRFLPTLIEDADVRAILLGMKPKIPLPAKATAAPSLAAERAQRIAIFLAFEERLHDLSRRLYSRDQAEALRALPDQFRTGAEKLDRLFAILLRIRKEAAIWLGFAHHQRRDKWRDELYFALAVYGLLHVRWDYDLPQSECALIAAGVAAASMPSTPRVLQERVDLPSTTTVGYPSYRVPLFLIHKHWKAKQYQQGMAIAEETVLDIKKTDSTAEILVRSDASHAIPLIGEGALLAVECGMSRSVEPILEALHAPAREFVDFETLGRIGRLFKESGDRRWEETRVEFAQLEETAAWQMYSKALTV